MQISPLRRQAQRSRRVSISHPKRVLIIGEEPELVDYSDPAIPRGMNARQDPLGARYRHAQTARGRFQPDMLLTTIDDAAAGEVAGGACEQAV